VRAILSAQPVQELAVDALAIPVAAGQAPDAALVELDAATAGLHRGGLFETLPVRATGLATPMLLLYGVGPVAELDGWRLREAHHEAVRAARRHGFRRLGIAATGPIGPDSLTAVVEGCVMGTWERRSRQTAAPERGQLDELVLAGFGAGRDAEVESAVMLGEATNRAREWTNQPPNELTPAALADVARAVAERAGLEIEVLGPDELAAGGYNLVLGVGRGSQNPPRFVRLRHRGATPGPTLALIGKGITFDTGGISLKSADRMSRMRGDLAGAAAVLAAMEVIAARRLPVDVVGVLASAENMPGGGAQRPGDVLDSANGKTVEVVNTDSEGRLVLADALTYALRSGATHIVDLATLTGAATTIAGHVFTPAVATDDELWDQVRRAGELAGDRLHRLPIYPDHRVLLRSEIADLRNSEYGEANTILGGMFIGEFSEGRPWVHLDIAATSWNTNLALTTVVRGPSGVGTRTCVKLAELMSATGR
jgi:leucyl aminopeptidase